MGEWSGQDTHEAPITGIDFKASKHKMVTGGADGIIRIYDLRIASKKKISILMEASPAKLRPELPSRSKLQVNRLKLSPCGELLAAGVSNSIHVFDFRNLAKPYALSEDL